MTQRKSSRLTPGAGSRSTVVIEGQEYLVRDTEWVIYDASGEPVGSMLNHPDFKDDPIKAARQYWQWEGQSAIMARLHNGERLVLMTLDRYRTEVHPLFMGGIRIEHNGKPGLFIPDKED